MKKYTAEELFADSLDGMIKVIAMIETGKFHVHYGFLGVLKKPKLKPNLPFSATPFEMRAQQDRYQAYLDERERASNYFSQFIGMALEEVSELYDQKIKEYVERLTLFDEEEKTKSLLRESKMKELKRSLGEVESASTEKLDLVTETLTELQVELAGVTTAKKKSRAANTIKVVRKNDQQECIERHRNRFFESKKRIPTKKELWHFMKSSSDGVTKIDNNTLNIEGKDVDSDAFSKRKFVSDLI